MRPLLALILSAASVQAGPDTLRLEVEPLPASVRPHLESGTPGPHVFAQPGHFTWCPSLARSADGRWLLAHSRWPTERSFLGWLTHSEVALAVADAPEGPYGPARTLVAAEPSPGSAWFNAHNPKLLRVGEDWWLYLIRTRANGPIDGEGRAEVSRVGYRHPLWMGALRPNQRTFVARASRPEGPWEVGASPLLEPSGPIATLVVNPGVCARPDGGFLMIVKGDKPGERRFIRNQAVAMADRPEGPWRLRPRAVIDDLDTEDVSVWRDERRGRYYAVFHTLEEGGFIGLMTSEDGEAWTRASQYRLTDKVLRLADGTVYRPTMMERPFVVIDAEGRPTHLLVACGLGRGTGIVILRLRAR